jgi:DNA-binding LacI/PurR family transcriptional regulator
MGIGEENERANAFARSFETLGGTVPPEWMLTHQENYLNAETLGSSILSAPPLNYPTAVFCATDGLAAVVIRTARKCGLEVPRDLSVAGFSDERLGRLLDPRLTTVAQPFEEIGRQSAEKLFQKMNGESGHAPESHEDYELLPIKLVVRDSTAKAPSAGKKK